jgi:hypothetical protein
MSRNKWKLTTDYIGSQKEALKLIRVFFRVIREIRG